MVKRLPNKCWRGNTHDAQQRQENGYRKHAANLKAKLRRESRNELLKKWAEEKRRLLLLDKDIMAY